MIEIKTHVPTGIKYACVKGYNYGTLLLPSEHKDYKILNSNLLLLRKQSWCV